jgi:hypothetical protein
MKKIFYIIFLLSVIPAAAFFIYGCGCSCDSAQEADIPDAVKKNADQVVISRTGKDFFEQFITLDLTRSKVIPPDYFIVYRLVIPDKPFVNETIEFTVDAEGKLNKKFSVTGIPECLSGGCAFEINEQEAIDIAAKEGMEKGIKEWKAAFLWNENFKRYVWRVVSVISESPNSQGNRSSGKDIIIDANTGEILENNDWHVR